MASGIGGKVALANPYEILKEEDALQQRLEKQAERERRNRQRQEEKAAAAAAEAAASAAAAAEVRAHLSPGAASLLQGARWADVDVDSDDDSVPAVGADSRRAATGTSGTGRREQHQRDAFYTDVESSSDGLDSDIAEDPPGDDAAASSSSGDEASRVASNQQQRLRSLSEARKRTKGKKPLRLEAAFQKRLWILNWSAVDFSSFRGERGASGALLQAFKRVTASMGEKSAGFFYRCALLQPQHRWIPSKVLAVRKGSSERWRNWRKR